MAVRAREGLRSVGASLTEASIIQATCVSGASSSPGCVADIHILHLLAFAGPVADWR